MRESVTVEVTSDDIANGVKGNCSRCPVALAIARLPRFSSHSVTVGLITAVTHDFAGRETNFIMAEEASSFIGQFDAGKPVIPFTFTMEAKP
jgi:hypothetical protein